MSLSSETIVAGISIGVAAFSLGYLLSNASSNVQFRNTKREEEILREADPSVKKAWAILRSEREELLNQLLESDAKAKKVISESDAKAKRVISEIRNEREELLSQLLDKSDRWTLTYFEGRGRAEQLRLLFAEIGVPFTDTRIKRDEWLSLKPNTPMGCLPVLEHNGKSIGESIAQVVYLAKEHDRWPRKPDQEAVALMVISATEDIKKDATAVMFASESDKPAKTEKLHQTLSAKLPFFERLLDHGFFTSGRITAADIVFWDALDQIVTVSPKAEGIINEFPQIDRWRRRVGELPNIAKYLKIRK